MVNFSIRRAREQAWRLATGLAELRNDADRRAHIQTVDTTMVAIAGRVLAPGVKVSTALLWVRLRERGSLAEKLDALLLDGRSR